MKTDIYIEHPEDYHIFDADTHYIPTLSVCRHLFDNEFKKQYGNKSGEKMFINLDTFLEQYTENSGGRVYFGRTDNGNTYVCICTPLMSRVHSMVLQSSEVMFVDAAGGMACQRYRVYLLITPTPAGGLPLGIIVCDSENEEVFGVALKQLIAKCFPDASFYGQKYPTLILTDNDLKERNPLHKQFPHSTLLLCQFHVLKAIWAWMLDSKHQIKK